MDNERKKQLKEAYKNYKPDMGVLAYIHTETGKHYIGYAKDIKGAINSNSFQLKCNSHPNKNLQKDFNQHPDLYRVEVLETFDYDKNDDGTKDYQPELEMLRELWLEKLPDAEILK